MSRRTDRRAFTLNEMLLILGLMAVAGLLTSRLYTASMRVIGSAPAAQDGYASLQRMTEALRRDVCSAADIQVSDGRAILLTTDDGQQVRWTLTDTEATRLPGPRRWNIPTPLRAEHHAQSLVLRSIRANGDSEGRRVFVSQVLLAQEMTR